MCYLWVGAVIIARFIYVMHAFHICGLCFPGALYVPLKAYFGRFQAIYGLYGGSTAVYCRKGWGKGYGRPWKRDKIWRFLIMGKVLITHKV